MGCEGHWTRVMGLAKDSEVSEPSKSVHPYGHWEWSVSEVLVGSLAPCREANRDYWGNWNAKAWHREKHKDL